jgi:hypothetical protein
MVGFAPFWNVPYCASSLTKVPWKPLRLGAVSTAFTVSHNFRRVNARQNAKQGVYRVHSVSWPTTPFLAYKRLTPARITLQAETADYHLSDRQAERNRHRDEKPVYVTANHCFTPD